MLPYALRRDVLWDFIGVVVHGLPRGCFHTPCGVTFFGTAPYINWDALDDEFPYALRRDVLWDYSTKATEAGQ